MATYDLTGGAGIPAEGYAKVYTKTATIDFSKQNVATSDIVKVFDVPAGTMVLGVFYKVTTAVGATCTADVGDSASATQFVSNANLNSTSTEDWSKLVEGTPNTLGKYYAAANDIRLTMDNGATAGVVKMTALMVKVF